MTEPSEDSKRIVKAAQDLSEHFDSVHIFATRHESGEKQGTITFQAGCGNWYARYGQVREWILKADQVSCEEAKEDRRA